MGKGDCRNSHKHIESLERSPEIDNYQIRILKQEIHSKADGKDNVKAVNVEFTVENISNMVLGSVLFNVLLHDVNGEVIDTLECKTVELKPKLPRTLHAVYEGYYKNEIDNCSIEVFKTTLIPEPIATGDERIKILYHTHLMAVEGFDKKESRIGLGIRNISDELIASVVFQAIFYNAEGNILTTIKHREGYLEPKRSRAIFIVYPDMESYDKVKSYNVSIVRTTTTDREKIQIRWCNLTTTDEGEKIEGTVKNISAVKTDIALIANFYNYQMENIGCRVISLRDIEPDSLKRFNFLFKPQEEENVKTFSIGFGELME
jgi:hypothetical protein